jgi:hypothetical protein
VALHKNGELDTRQIARCLTDTSALIRAEIIPLTVPFLQDDEELQRKVLALCNDKSAEVRLVLLKNLPHFDSARTTKPLTRILIAQSRSPEAWRATLPVLEGKLSQTLKTLLIFPHPISTMDETSALFRKLGSALASREEWFLSAMDALSENTSSPLWQRVAFLEGLAKPASGFPLLKSIPKTLDTLTRSPEAPIASRATEIKRSLAKKEAKP